MLLFQPLLTRSQNKKTSLLCLSLPRNEINIGTILQDIEHILSYIVIDADFWACLKIGHPKLILDSHLVSNQQNGNLYWKSETTFFIVFLPAQNMLPAQFFSHALGSNHNPGFLGSVARFRIWEQDPNTKLMVRRQPIFCGHIGGNYRTSSAHRARSLPSCSLRSIVLPENPCARSRFFEKMCRISCIFFFPRKKFSAYRQPEKMTQCIFLNQWRMYCETAPCWLRHMLPEQNEKKDSP